MHPTLDELLELRDGGGNSAAREHAESCTECRGELARLAKLRGELRALPPDRPELDFWPLLARRASASRRLRRLRVAAAAAILIVAAGTGGTWWMQRARNNPKISNAPVSAAPAPEAKAQQAPAPKSPGAEVAALITRSQKLEALIKKYEEQSPVLNGRSVGAVANIQERIALIDLQIGLADDANTSKERLTQLWKYRVQLLTSLVELHESHGAYVSV